MAYKEQLPLRGEFGYSLQEKELIIFKDARLFRVTLFANGVSNRETLDYPNYPLALFVALHTERSILHAVTPTGSSFCVPQNEYEKYLNVYNELTGQKLKMPIIPKVTYEHRKSSK
jgi:hypothetical protein